MAGSYLRLPVRICRGPPWVCYDSGTYCTLSAQPLYSSCTNINAVPTHHVADIENLEVQ